MTPGVKVVDKGTYSLDSVDNSDFGAEVARAVASCGLPDAEVMSRPLSTTLDVPPASVGEDSDPSKRGSAAESADGDVESYLRLHSGVAGGETRSLLMRWPELRSLAAVILPSGRRS